MILTEEEKKRIDKKRSKPTARYNRGNRSEITKIIFASGLFADNHWLFKKGLTYQDVYFLCICDCLQNCYGYFSMSDLLKGTSHGYSTIEKRMSKHRRLGLIERDLNKSAKDKSYYITTFGRDVLKSLSRVVLNYLDYGKATYEIRMFEDNPKGGYASGPSGSGTKSGK